MTDGHHAEIERKYAVGEAAVVPDLAQVPGVAEARPVAAAHLEAVYFDTADRVLARARIALRRRRGGHDSGWHVKLPAAVGRTEVHGEIDERSPDTPPPAVLDAVRSRVRDAALEPIARIETTRTAVLLVDATGTERVEFADDVVRATDVARGVLRAWREWEAEQVGDAPAVSARLLDALEPVLLSAGARPSVSPSKLAQALGETGDEEPPAASTAGEAVRRLIAAQVEQLHRDAFALQHGGAEAVHGMRKTVRRLRALLALDDVVGPAGRRLRDRLRLVGATLGDARDATVAAATAAALLDALPATVPGIDAARRRLVDSADERAAEAQRRAVAAFRADAHLDLLADLDAFARTLPSGPDALEPPDLLPRLATAAVGRAARRSRHLDESLSALHDARKAAKRARYLIESLDDAGLLSRGSSLRRLARRAERVHDAIGRHRDLALLVDELPFVSQRAAADGENAYVYGVVAERGGRELDRLRARIDRAVAKLAAAAR
ncbi:CYTH and CHAD domain-containing protein [Amnibacterium sp. CER49]|uniref:CYTH and CHAD domain-containing protein n=1 Tax=Amnibacterium sp. CER49 TaxID=3039161 RepID=UPI00244A2E32|nr:CYTH and CHAD domain-containing protein [Amnibacterium sp. CER49]MDH2444465.1 CYTH and CHAD domain-containing protein [Amnibacterium sp. CER49]